MTNSSESPEPAAPPPVRKTAKRGYGGRSAEELSAERRQRLMETALELFGTEGYLPTTVEKLCSHARVTTRHFYEHFRDRESLLIALFEEILADTQRRVMTVMLDDAAPPEARFSRALDAFLASHLDDPRRARITTQEILGVSPRAEAARNRVISGFADLITAYLGGLVANGRLPARNYRVLAVGIVGAMHELQIAWLDGSLGLSRQALAEELAFLVAAMVRGAR